MKLLVVDDDPILRKGYEHWLKDHDVVALSSVSFAIELMEKGSFKPDVIICDNNTGAGPQGIDFAEKLSQSEYKGKFVLCTGDILGDLERRVKDLGYSFIRKPMLMQDLSNILNN